MLMPRKCFGIAERESGQFARALSCAADDLLRFGSYIPLCLFSGLCGLFIIFGYHFTYAAENPALSGTDLEHDVIRLESAVQPLGLIVGLGL